MRLIQNSARTDNNHGGQSSADLRQQGRASLACVETEWLLGRPRGTSARPRGGALGVGIRQSAAGRGDDVPHRWRGIQEGSGRRVVKSDLLR